jgi:formate dehydrogenase maturation protein FdhE
MQLTGIGDTGQARTTGDGCPRCGATGATMTLLTAMVRYFMCDRCQCRWQVSRPGWSGTTDL